MPRLFCSFRRVAAGLQNIHNILALLALDLNLILDFSMQEQTTAPLLFFEMVTALGVLAPGGSLVVRTFTIFEHTSVCALYLLGSLFQEVHLFKPATSKASNSEMYVVAKGFKVSDLNPNCSEAACCAALSFDMSS